MISGKANARLVVAGLWLLTFTPAARAQTARSESVGLQAKQIILPLELIASEPATLAVLMANGRVAPGVNVVLSSGEVVTTDESGRAHFLAPPDRGVMFARIPGTAVREAADVLPEGSAGGSAQPARIPRLVSLANCFAIDGEGFQGDADRNRIEVSGKPILVLASSPVQLVVMPPAHALPGEADLTLVEGTKETATQVTFVDVIRSNASDGQIHRGKKASVILRALGTTEPLELDVRNLSPQVVQFQHGNEVRLQTAGGSDNSAVIQWKGKSAGTFSFAVTLESTSTGANAPVARDFLEAARKIVAPDPARGVESILEQLRANHVDGEKVRDDLQQISTQNGSEDFRALMRAARRAISGE